MLRILLIPFALFYRALLFWRNAYYHFGFFISRRLPVPVVSVGNLTVGGTGKTPMVIHLAERLQARGIRVAVVSRGYGRETRGTVVVSDGTGSVVDWRTGGDEPVLIARRLNCVPVVVDENRYRGGVVATERFRPGVILLDDGFQHRALARALDIVLLNAAAPEQDYRLLPYGKSREPVSALRRADLVIWTKRNHGAPPPTMEGIVGRSGCIIAESSIRLACTARTPRGEDVSLDDWKGKPAFAFCGVAAPDSFWAVCEEAGLWVAGRRSFRDHHPYSVSDVAELESQARKAGAEVLVTTEKDLVKMAPLALSLRLPVLGVVLAVTFSADGDAAVNAALDRALRRRGSRGREGRGLLGRGDADGEHRADESKQ